MTCKKKKGVRCRFNAPWPPSEETKIIRGNNYSKDEEKESKEILDKVLGEVIGIDDHETTLAKVLDSCGVSENEYSHALEVMAKKITILYKRKPNEEYVSPYNTVLLSLMKSNMNIQFITGVYGLLAYLTSYLCKPEHKASELMKKAGKEASGLGLKEKLRKAGNVFLTKREVTTPEAIKRTLSLPMRSSNIACKYIYTGKPEDRLRVLKPKHVLETMDPDDPDIYSAGVMERYINRPDKLENLCYADFAANYVSTKVNQELEEDDIENYTTQVSNTDDQETWNGKIIELKNEYGKMRKRTHPIVIRYHKVSLLKEPELYYMTLIQLYLPWRNETDLISGCATYAQKFELVKDILMPNLKKHDAWNGEYDLDEDMLFERDESDNDVDNNLVPDLNDYGMLNPNLLDLNIDHSSTNVSSGPVGSSSVDDESIPQNVIYDMCSELNGEQQQLFDFMMKYAQQLQLNERNDLPDPEPFNIFLSGGAGVGKTYLTVLIREYFKKTWKVPGQNMDEHPAVVVTASTGKAAVNIDGTTLHSAFALPVRDNGSFANIKLGRDKKDYFQRKYVNLKALIIDEISMIDKLNFDDLNTNMRDIFDEDRILNKDFGGKSMLVIGDFLQLPAKIMIFQRMTPTDSWYSFKYHELTEIMRQSSDPSFAELLNRVRVGEHTDADVKAIHDLEHTDVTSWPENHLTGYMTNRLVNKRNSEVMDQASSTIFTINAYDANADSHTGSFKYTLNDDMDVGKTGNMRKALKIWVGARVILTDNLDVDDRLCNGSEGTVKYIHLRTTISSAKHGGTIYVLFDDEKAGNQRKSNSLPDELQGCVPITVKTKKFIYVPPGGKKRFDNSIQCERKQFPLLLAHATTVHKTQGRTLDYLTGDLDNSTRNPNRKISKHFLTGLVYTLLSRVRRRDTIRIQNFHKDLIVHNEEALKEMERLRKDCPFAFEHPLQAITGTKICLNNIRGWQAHITHFLSNRIYTNYSSVLCFTETIYLGSPLSDISKHLGGWKSIHHPTAPDGLAICYDDSKVIVCSKNIPERQFQSQIEIMSALLSIEGEEVLIVLLYRPPSTNQQEIHNFIEDLTFQLNELQINQYNTIVLGDFNLDQMLDAHVDLFNRICTQFSLFQRSNYSTHIHGGILDLVFHNKKQDPVEWIPTPYSDHFVLIIDI